MVEPNLFPQPQKPNAQTPSAATLISEANQQLQGSESTVKSPP